MFYYYLTFLIDSYFLKSLIVVLSYLFLLSWLMILFYNYYLFFYNYFYLLVKLSMVNWCYNAYANN